MRSVTAALALSACLSVGSVAIAQEGPVAHVSGDDTADQIAQWVKADDRSLDINLSREGASPPRQIHGEVGLTVSNRGYGGYAAVAMPVGQASELDVAIGAGQERLPFGKPVNSRSLSVGIMLDGSDVGRWLSHDTCGVQHTGIRLRDDPVLLSDGSCVKPESRSAPPSGNPGG
jgi:hypothetical protein